MMPTDPELLELIRQRDAHAFDLLSSRYESTVRRAIARIVTEANATDDLTQEVLLRVWTHAGQWQGEGSFGAWLLRIATNMALNHLRTVSRRREEPLVLPAADARDDEEMTPAWLVDACALGPDAVVEIIEQKVALNRYVSELPAEKREVYRLVHEAEMELREVSETLGIPEGTVRSRLHYARKRLALDMKLWEEQ